MMRPFAKNDSLSRILDHIETPADFDSAEIGHGSYSLAGVVACVIG
jgi:hypothetical protein